MVLTTAHHDAEFRLHAPSKCQETRKFKYIFTLGWMNLSLKEFYLSPLLCVVAEPEWLNGAAQCGSHPGADSASHGASQWELPGPAGGRHDETHPQARHAGKEHFLWELLNYQDHYAKVMVQISSVSWYHVVSTDPSASCTNFTIVAWRTIQNCPCTMSCRDDR